MLYLIHRANHEELTYRGGQTPIVHLEADLLKTVAWANQNNRKWAFTLSNAGASYFESRCDFDQLGEVNWAAWPAPGSEDTELGVLIGPEVRHGEAEVYARVQA